MEFARTVDKGLVLDVIRQVAGPELARLAAQVLPDQVDLVQHADTLREFGVPPGDLISRLGI
jgi:hypothetical protein